MEINDRRKLWKMTSLLIMHIPLWLLLTAVGWISIKYLSNPTGFIGNINTIVYLFRVTPIVMCLILFFIFIFSFLFYIFIWRMAFPDYIRMIINEKDDSVSGFLEGRIYWINNFGFSKTVNDWLELPEKDRAPKMWYTLKWPWNILLPMRGLFTCTELKADDISRDGTFKIEVITRGGMKYKRPRVYNIGSFPLTMVDVPMIQSDATIMRFLNDTYRDSALSSQSDPQVQKDQLRNSAIKIDDDIQDWLEEYIPLEITADFEPLAVAGDKKLVTRKIKIKER